MISALGCSLALKEKEESARLEALKLVMLIVTQPFLCFIFTCLMVYDLSRSMYISLIDFPLPVRCICCPLATFVSDMAYPDLYKERNV